MERPKIEFFPGCQHPQTTLTGQTLYTTLIRILLYFMGPVLHQKGCKAGGGGTILIPLESAPRAVELF